MKIGSLFSGYGGLDLGVQAALGGYLAWHCDNDPGAARILAHRHPDVPNLGDITIVDWAQVEPVDVLTAGYPCQPFSHAGKRKGADDDRYLWPEVARAIRVLGPRLVVLENVRGHVVRGFPEVVGSLADCGYDARWTCLRAADVGAPHGRDRLFVVAHPDEPGLERREPARRRLMLDGGTAADTGGQAQRLRAGLRESQPGRVRRGRPDDGGSSDAAADADGDGSQGVGRVDTIRRDSDRRGDQNIAWGQYESAIQRWEHVLGRRAPDPTEPGRTGQPRLSPAFVEFLMGLPEGHVTDVPDLTRNAQLKALGNGVVPQQAEAALRLLLGGEAVKVTGAARLLPTPDTMNHRDGSKLRQEQIDQGGSHALSLHHWAHLLPTPRATDGTKGGPNQRGSSGDLMLPSAVQQIGGVA